MLWRVLHDELALFLLFFALTATALHAAEPLAGSSLVVEGLGRGTVALDGQWQFHVGDDPAWSSPTADDNGWEYLRVDRPWGDQGHYGYAGFAWYRRHLDFVQSPASPAEVLLYMPHVRCAYEVYWNGQLVGHFGTLPASPFFAPRRRRHLDSGSRGREYWRSGLGLRLWIQLPPATTGE